MQYEIHITVGNILNTEKFKADCSYIGVKPIIIETENKSEKENQVMTSSKHSGESHFRTLDNICSALVGWGYDVVRKKVEIYPQHKRNKDFKYYESHIRLKLPKGFDRSQLVDLCNANEFHLSKNLFKQDAEYDYQMCTFRSSDLTFWEFKNRINGFKSHLLSSKIVFDKIEIEECIYDTNEKIDSKWLKN